MVINYSSLKLGNVMMHRVLRDNLGEHTFSTMLTDAPVDLSPQDLGYLVSRFQKSLYSRALPIVQADAEKHPARDTLLALWASSTSLEAASKLLADALASTQPGTAAEGLLVVAEASLGNEEGFVIAKVEHQEAMRLEPTKDEHGNNVFAVELLRDLVFGDKTRIYKVAIFIKAWSAAGFVSGEAVDEQSDRNIAAYFLGKFLGMRLREEPSVMTEMLLDGITQAINRSTMTGDQKVEVQHALLSELRSNDKQFDPTAFIQKHVPNGHGKEIASLAQAAHAPLIAFSKDNSRIDSRMRKVRIELENDITITAPPEEVGGDGAVQVSDGAAGPIVEIRGARVETVKNGAR
ncbi:hypothetical protein ASF40_20010 [Microbacterium sp. Leaf288]|uniref:nucleoid-associated protein n=1 Tax=Microbacterium sp. Leaf288 TaxID=1736323 RepID=UPI0006FEE1FA|nr:nucleoid-associated protein [Microbacterium sp. Leaf288]KQP67818.1 hypothetical protein ASF40_20010 [Microbacterium sp. Leaf288]